MQIIKMKRVILLLMSLFVTFSVNAQIKDFVILGGELSNSAATSVRTLFYIHVIQILERITNFTVSK